LIDYARQDGKRGIILTSSMELSVVLSIPWKNDSGRLCNHDRRLEGNAEARNGLGSIGKRFCHTAIHFSTGGSKWENTNW
jgi:hypothetical protein